MSPPDFLADDVAGIAARAAEIKADEERAGHTCPKCQVDIRKVGYCHIASDECLLKRVADADMHRAKVEGEWR